MTTAPPGEDDIEDRFRAALAREARAAPAEVPAPPRLAVSADPDAPHGRGEDGEPLAPHGLRKDGRPALKPAGPGRGHAADKPRMQKAPSPRHAAPPGTAAVSYADELAGTATAAWMAMAACKGGKAGPVRIPDLRPYAHAWHESMPAMVTAWDRAARQSPAVRGWVEKLAGDGSWSWVFGVGIATGQLAAACIAVRGDDKARAAAAAASDAEFADFMAEQAAAIAAAAEGNAT